MLRVVLVITCATALVAVGAAPAGAATHKTYRFFSKEIASSAFDAAGNALPQQSGPPPVGASFYSTDDDYLGNHTKHAKTAFATDHIHCTFTAVDVASNTFTAVCDAQLALPGGMVFFDHQTVNFAQDRTVIPITGGTGKYAGAKGSVTTTSFSDQSDDSDLVVSVTF